MAPTTTPATEYLNSHTVGTLEWVWARIRLRHHDLPEMVAMVGSGLRNGQYRVRGHWWRNKWQAGDAQRHEFMLSGERLEDGAEGVLATTLHEAAHALATARGITDTSRRGEYHNRKFKALAEDLGLTVSKHRHRGFACTELSDAARHEYAEELGRLSQVIRAYRSRPGGNVSVVGGPPNGGDDNGRGTNPRRRRITLKCRCLEPRRIRVAHGVVDKGPITCGLCNGEFGR